MRNTNSKVRCEKRRFSKSEEVVRSYSKIQLAYAELLESDPNVASFNCNVQLTGFDDGDYYTTDFLIQKIDGEIAVRECCFKKLLTKPMNARLLQSSLDYWARRGVADWGVVIDKEE